MKISFVLVILGCLFGTAELWTTEQPSFGDVTETGTSGNCSDLEVQCFNATKCIPKVWLCDGIQDCEDNSDELGCQSTTTYDYKIFEEFLNFGEDTTKPNVGCDQNHVQCYNSTSCIPTYWICDNYTDCGDGSDETDCYRRTSFFDQYTTPEPQTTEFTGCSPDEFQCLNSSKCIPNFWICDNFQDCQDNSDENPSNCYLRQTSISFYEHTTPSEFQATQSGVCGPSQVKCNDSSRCIPFSWLCDNFKDCDDNSDETDCPPYTTNQPAFNQPSTQDFQTYQHAGCSPDEFQCLNSSKCIPNFWICDNFQDCQDNSDENPSNCYLRQTSIPFYEHTTPSEFQATQSGVCSPSQVKCNDSSRCIPFSWLCDNFKDCDDNSDETDCPPITTNRPAFNQPSTQEFQTYQPGCSPDEFQCLNSSKCIPTFWICDNIQDCQDNSDENPSNCYLKQTSKPFYEHTTPSEFQTTESGVCSPSQVKCNDSSRCIPLSWLCDSFKDCDDNSDETDCPPITTNQTAFNQTSAPEFQTFQPDETFAENVTTANFVTKKPHSHPKTKSPCPKKFNCGDYCIGQKRVCDGKEDCLDGRDEADCPSRRK